MRFLKTGKGGCCLSIHCNSKTEKQQKILCRKYMVFPLGTSGCYKLGIGQNRLTKSTTLLNNFFLKILSKAALSYSFELVYQEYLWSSITFIRTNYMMEIRILGPVMRKGRFNLKCHVFPQFSVEVVVVGRDRHFCKW